MLADKKKLQSFYNESAAYLNILSDLSHYDRETNLKQYADIVSRFAPPGGSVIDLGCGTGDTTYFLMEKSLSAIGVDISTLLVLSRTGESRQRPAFVIADIAVLPFRTKSVSCVALHDVIEHIPDVEDLLREIARVVKNDGRVVICSPNLLSPVKPLFHIFGKDGLNTQFYGSVPKAVLAIFSNLALSLQKTFSKRAAFLYREPILDGFQCPDDDATFLCNYADLRNWFEAHGFSVRYHQVLPGRGLVGRVKSGVVKCLPWIDKGFCLVAERKSS